MKPFDLMVVEARKSRKELGGDWVWEVRKNNPGVSYQRVSSIIKFIILEVMYPSFTFAELKRLAKQHIYGK